MDTRNLIEALLRWTHVVAAILWVGLLLFFNLVNARFAPTLPEETRKKVLPELLPRALYFFRWGAAITWFTGLLLLGLVYYSTKLHLDLTGGRKPGSGIMILVVFLAFGPYDQIFRKVKSPVAQLILGFVLSTVFVFFLRQTGFSYRGAAIHLGALFGTIMAANAMMRIWPAQRRVLLALQSGGAPDPDSAQLASTRSRHNLYLSIPVVFTMLSQHGTFASDFVVSLPILILVGFAAAFGLERLASSPKAAALMAEKRQK